MPIAATRGRSFPRRIAATISSMPNAENMMAPLVARFAMSGMSPESSGAASMMMRNAPIAMPDPTAMTKPFTLGRTAPFSGTKPTSTTATRATPSAM